MSRTMATASVHDRSAPLPRRCSGSSWRWRVKTALVLLAALLPLVLAGVWGAYARANAWKQWLGRLTGGPGSRQASEGGLGSRAAGEPGIAYQGEGRVALGDFSVKIFNPVTHVTLRVDFQLEGLTSCDGQESFEEFAAMYQRFVREQVMVSVRSADLEDLTDPDLGLLKRSIVARVNLALGEPFLKSVDIRKFALFESIDRSSYVRFTPEDAADAPGP